MLFILKLFNPIKNKRYNVSHTYPKHFLLLVNFTRISFAQMLIFSPF